jgi:hypothetical protein
VTRRVGERQSIGIVTDRSKAEWVEVVPGVEAAGTNIRKEWIERGVASPRRLAGA